MSKVTRILSILEREIEIDRFLKRGDPFKVLITTLLSQRTRDKNTDRASRALFSRFRNAKQLAEAGLEEIEALIRPSGFYKVKARRIREISRILVRENGGRVPGDLEGMMRLPGIGRKTGNCVLVYAYGEPSIPVDTHCHRIPNRIGIVKTSTPEETERELMRIVPRDKWMVFNEVFVKFGQRICRPVRPLCYRCPIEKLCDYPDKNLDSSK
jgi:endonuclease-3